MTLKKTLKKIINIFTKGYKDKLKYYYKYKYNDL